MYESITTYLTNLDEQTMYLVTFCTIALVVVLFIISKLKKFIHSRKKLYIARTFLTKNEKDCFQHLKKEFPEYHICPQVSMGALLEPNINSKNPNKKQRSEYTILRNKIQSKVVDFVMMDEDLNVAFIIELDDKSHDSKLELDALRDKNFAGAGIPTVRFRRNDNKFLSREEIESQLNLKSKNLNQDVMQEIAYIPPM